MTPSRILHMPSAVLQLRLLHCNDKPDVYRADRRLSSVLKRHENTLPYIVEAIARLESRIVSNQAS